MEGKTPPRLVVLTPEQEALLDETIYDAIALPERTVNYLEPLGVFTLRDLLMCTPRRLLAIPNFGVLTLKDVYRRLAAAGFYSDAFPSPEAVYEKKKGRQAAPRGRGKRGGSRSAGRRDVARRSSRKPPGDATA